MTRAPAFTLLAFATLAGCGGEPAAVPTPTAGKHYVAVHIDSLSPEKAAQFEDARKSWVAEMKQRNASDARGTFLQTDANRFYTVRPFARFAELDARADRVARALAPVPKTARDDYDHRSDEALVFPHASEIWEVDDELGFSPTANALALDDAACGLLVIEDLRPDPTSEARYAAAWSQAKMALASSSFPLTGIRYRSVFGSGRLVTMWLAHSKQELDQAKPEKWLVKALGDSGAGDLKTAVAAVVLHEESSTFVVRKDLSSF